MSTVTLTNRPPTRRAIPSISIAGVEWPAHKALAVLVGAIVAVVLGVLTRSGEITAWVVLAASGAAWWTVKLTSGRAAAESAT